MKKYKSFIIGSLWSLIFILLSSALFFYGNDGVLYDMNFLIHTIPFFIGFSGGATFFILLYYVILWLLITSFFRFTFICYKKTRFKYLIVLIFVLVFTTIFISSLIFIQTTLNEDVKELTFVEEDFILNLNNLSSSEDKSIKNGDIIFQVSKSSQSLAIQKATHSKYSHVGLIFIENGKEFVFEASNVVKNTPLNEWINRGEEKHYVVKRLINSDSIITNESKLNLRREAAKYLDKTYDLHFDWSDDKMYCSELVWKIYKQGLDIEVGALEEMKDFDFTTKEVAKIIKARYGDSIPLNEKVISPVSIYNSDKLITVIDK